MSERSPEATQTVMMPNLLNVYKRIQITDGCWLWTGTRDKKGYGSITWGWKANKKTRKAHQIVYAMVFGPVPAGLVLDHTCHNDARNCTAGDNCLHRRCVNPAHLEPVTHIENCRRRPYVRAAYCKKGHDFSIPGVYDERYKACAICRRTATRLSARRHSPTGRNYTDDASIFMASHCKNGHEYTEENTAVYSGNRYCKECSRIKARAYYWKRRVAVQNTETS